MPSKHEPLVKRLYFQVLVGIVGGVLLGWLQPEWGVAMRPLGDGFIKLIRMVIGPIIFGTVVVGIAKTGHMKDVGRLGMKALIYFEVVSTVALILGMTFVNLINPGAGVNADAGALDPRVAAYTASAAKLTTIDFLMNIIPTTVVDAFATGNVLQVLFFSILFGMALLYLGEKGRPFVGVIDDFTHGMFGVVGMIMWVASIGSFGAMAFVIGEYGIGTIVALGKLLIALFVTCAVFVGVVLGGIAYWVGVNLWQLAKYIKEEILIVAGTASGEAVFPRLMAKLEHLGCSKSVVGLVIPTGYSFNLDGTSIYMSMAAIFIAQATNTDLTIGQQFGILAVLLLTSKGSAGVAGAGFVALAATVSTIPVLPVAGLGLLLGIDPFLSRVRAPTNLMGNTLATIVIAKWEGALDSRRMKRVLSGETVDEADEPEKVLVAEAHAAGGRR